MTPSSPAILRALVTSVLVLGALSPGPASAASPGEEARAATLFDAAKELHQAGQDADACPMFAESKRLSPGVGVTLHLADCYERIGRAASAWNQFVEAEQLARSRHDDARAVLAHMRAEALVGRLDRITVATSAGLPPGSQVSIDGAILPAERLNAALAVDPGDHSVTVREPGRVPRTRWVRVDGANPVATAQLDEPGPVAPLAQVAPPVTPPVASVSPEMPLLVPVTPSRASRVRLGIEIGFLGLGAIGVGFGTFFLVRRSELIRHREPDDPSLEQQASIAASLSFVTGGVAFGSALALFLTGQNGTSSTGWVLSPIPLAGGAGALVHTSF